jgi:protein-S-isoprenylcysteine O-methyltransferase Ste14
VTAAVSALWLVFGLYWLVASIGAKHGSRGRQRWHFVVLALVVFVLLRIVGPRSLAVHSSAVRAVGLGILVAGLGLAVWARVYLGRNWGMPMTKKDEPELVTSGPYRFVRHPIYAGCLVAMLGTAVATSISRLIVLAVVGAYFVYSARVEERLMSASFPTAYPAYRARTKMLIPFLL